MKRLAVLSFAAAALVVPSGALASGVVVKVQRAAHLVAVAQPTKQVRLVHTALAAKLHVGQRVALTARTLRNGTLAASRVRVLGRVRTAQFRGLLLARDSRRFVVSAGGAVIAVRHGADDRAPKPGTTVDVTVTVGAAGDLDDDDITPVSADQPGGAIEGRLTLGTATITVVSEHLALRLAVPTGFDLTSFRNGDEVLAMFSQQPDGTLVLTKLTGDDDARDADDDDSGGDHHGGHDGHDDGD